MPWKPERPGERPTLGALVVDWIETNLAAPDGRDGLVRLTREQVEFTLRFYELDPDTCTRRRRRGVLSRAKGWGRSPFMAMLGVAEAFAPVVADGWDAQGRPVGKPWSTVRTPWVQVLAVSEDQTRNAWLPLLEMVRGGPVADFRGVDILETFIVLPGRRGRIEYTTASAVSREGNRPVFAVLDGRQSWTDSNGGTRLAAAVRRNLGKTGGVSIEAPNAYRPGAGSVAEASANYAEMIATGNVRDDGLLYDHRAASASVDLTDDDQLLPALRFVYGDSSGHPDGCVLHTPPSPGWQDLGRIMREIRDPDTMPAEARQFFLNQPTSAEDAWVTSEQVDSIIADLEIPLRKAKAKTAGGLW